MVPIYGTCYWIAAGTFRYGAKAETPNFWVILFSVFLQPVQETDRQADRQTCNERGNILITQHCGRLGKVCLSLAFLPA
jgi:hypothetical protein